MLFAQKYFQKSGIIFWIWIFGNFSAFFAELFFIFEKNFFFQSKIFSRCMHLQNYKKLRENWEKNNFFWIFRRFFGFLSQFFKFFHVFRYFSHIFTENLLTWSFCSLKSNYHYPHQTPGPPALVRRRSPSKSPENCKILAFYRFFCNKRCKYDKKECQKDEEKVELPLVLWGFGCVYKMGNIAFQGHFIGFLQIFC